jgi:hypothetical protein
MLNRDPGLTTLARHAKAMDRRDELLALPEKVLDFVHSPPIVLVNLSVMTVHRKLLYGEKDAIIILDSSSTKIVGSQIQSGWPH